MAGEFPAPIDVLPHRDPILWVDEVTALEDRSIEAVWTPRIDEHFRSGSLDKVKLIEALAQAGAYRLFLGDEETRLPLFGAIDSAAFPVDVQPGEQIHLRVDMHETGDDRKFAGKGVATVAGGVACEAEIAGAVLKERSALLLMRRREVIDGTNDSVPSGAFISPDQALGKVSRDIALDSVVSIVGRTTRGSWLPGQAWYDGHEFGGQFVLPGVRQVASMRDAAEYDLFMRDIKGVRFSAVAEVSFVSPVRPSERLDVEVESSDVGPEDMPTYYATAMVAGELVSSATLFFEEPA